MGTNYQQSTRSSYFNKRPNLPSVTTKSFRGLWNVHFGTSIDKSERGPDQNRIDESNSNFNVRFAPADIYEMTKWETMEFFAAYFCLICSTLNRSISVSRDAPSVAYVMTKRHPQEAARLADLRKTDVTRIVDVVIEKNAWKITIYSINRRNPDASVKPLARCDIYSFGNDIPSTDGISELLSVTKTVQHKLVTTSTIVQEHLGVITTIIWNATVIQVITDFNEKLVYDEVPRYRNFHAMELILGESSQEYNVINRRIKRPLLPMPEQRVSAVLERISMVARNLTFLSSPITSQTLDLSIALSFDVEEGHLEEGLVASDLAEDWQSWT